MMSRNNSKRIKLHTCSKITENAVRKGALRSLFSVAKNVLSFCFATYYTAYTTKTLDIQQLKSNKTFHSQQITTFSLAAIRKTVTDQKNSFFVLYT